MIDMRRNTTRAALALLAVACLMGGCDDKKKAAREAAKQDPAAQEGDAMALVRVIGAWGTPPPGTRAPAPGGGPVDLMARNYYAVFDGSGSMEESGCSGGARGGRIVPAREAMVRFSRLLPQSANLGLFVFDENGVGERVPLGHGAANRAAFEAAVRAIRAGNDTPLGAALQTGLDKLRERAVIQHGYGSYHIVVTTDGAATDGDAMPQAVEEIERTPVVLNTIGLCIEGGHPLNVPGKTVYQDARDPASLEAGLGEVVAEATTVAGDDAPAGAQPGAPK